MFSSMIARWPPSAALMIRRNLSAKWPPSLAVRASPRWLCDNRLCHPCIPKLQVEAILKNSPSLGVKLMRSICRKLSSMAHLCVEFQDQECLGIASGNTEASLRKKLHERGALLDGSGPQPTSARARPQNILATTFSQTNPWGHSTGEKKMLLDSSSQNPFSNNSSRLKP